MAQSLARDVHAKVRKLAQLAAALRRGESFQVTRLTSLKSLCQEPGVTNRFATYLARKTLERVARGQVRAERLPAEQRSAHRRMMSEALAAMNDWNQAPTEARREHLRELLSQFQAEQNEHRSIPWGAVRIIHDADLLLVEYALRCLLHPPHEAGYWVYQTARHYAERYSPHHPSGLVPESAPLVQDIADFWAEEYGVDLGLEQTRPEPKPSPSSRPQSRAGSGGRSRQGRSQKGGRDGAKFTHRQGQFLAFIHLYRKLHRRGPAELDLVKFFRVTPPSVHGMVVKLEELGLVTREPGVARSIRVALPEEEIPALENVAGPPW